MQNQAFDFDTIIDRRNTNCGRWDTMDKKYGTKGLIHLGVADMDFASPEPIREELRKYVEHGVFGYTDLSEAFYDGFISWMQRRHGIQVQKEEIVFCPRINVSSSLCVEVYTEPGDEVVIHTPAYGPLYQAIVKNERKALESPLKIEEGKYKIDFEQLEQSVSEKTKMFILCSPHNPVGRVWTRAELEAIGEFCLKHNLVLFIDEIHGDLVAKGITFTSALALSEQVREILVIAASPTKTFNIPGMILSYLVIPNQKLREKIVEKIDRIGMHNPNIFSMAAVEAAYTKCDDWYEAMLNYINENEAFTRAYFAEYMPGFHIYDREGTYLLWMDYAALQCTEEELETWFLERAKVSVYMGTVFREQGRGFIRMNLASARALLAQAYQQMSSVYSELL